MRLLENEISLITGAGQGIGAAAAKLFAIHGATVIVNDLNQNLCDEVVQSITDAGGNAHAAYGDITRVGMPEKLLSQIHDQFGRLNVLVNNAGFLWDGMIHKMSDDQWQQIQNIHTRAPFRLIRSLAEYWRPAAKEERKAGLPHPRRCIVNVSSTSGLHGNIGQINYATAKMGLVGLTKTVAKEWGFLGIRCNAVAFGMIDTRLTRPLEDGRTFNVGDHKVSIGIPDKIRSGIQSMIPLQRYGTPEEAAGGILYLASPLADYVSGHTLEVTGGQGI